MSDDVVKNYLAKVVERAGLTREVFTDRNAPKSLGNIVVVPFLGDIRHEFIFSTLMLNKWKELNKFSYLVVCSWPGHYGLYPYADEYWSVSDSSTLDNLVRGSHGFVNTNAGWLERLLLRYLDNNQLLLPDDKQLIRLYKDGITPEYIREFDGITYSLPNVPSPNLSVNRELDTSKKTVFIMPSLTIDTWRRQKSASMHISKEFWEKLIKRLLDRYNLIVYQNYFTHDLENALDEKVFLLKDWNILSALAAMRACDCVVDVFNQIGKYAYIARTPTLVLDERQRYFGKKDYEIDDLCARDVFKRYFFSFAPFLDGDQTFAVEGVMMKLKEFFESPKPVAVSATEMTINVPYGKVRKRWSKSLRPRLFNPPLVEEEN